MYELGSDPSGKTAILMQELYRAKIPRSLSKISIQLASAVLYWAKRFLLPDPSIPCVKYFACTVYGKNFGFLAGIQLGI